MKINSVMLSANFTIIGFIGLAVSHYGEVIQNDYVTGFALAGAVVGLVLGLGFIIIAMNKELREKKDAKEKQG